MIESKATLKEWIKIEQNQYQKLGYKGKLHAFITQCEIGKIVAYTEALRKDEYYTNKPNSSIFNKIFLLYWRRRHNQLGCKFGISIPVNTFEKGLIIFHLQSIIIHRNVQCGEYCRLHGMNCIGNNGRDISNKNVPVLGNRIDVGVGASIIGAVKIADNVKIGAGAVVCKSCEKEKAVLVGIPAYSK